MRRRHVVYVPGYDPHAESRARMLFVREFGRYARRFGLTARAVSKSVPLPDDLGSTWTIDAAADGWSTHATYDVLRWDDIVRRDFARPVATRVLLLLVGFVHSLATGVMVRFFRLNWKFGGVILYPLVMIALATAVALGAGLVAAGLAHWLVPSPVWVRAVLAIVVALLVVAGAIPLFERWFVWHLLHDWVFNWQHGNGWRADYEARVDVFARHLSVIAARDDADEIVVVGHSSGSVMAVEVVARALEHDPGLGTGRAAIALLTIGSCLPLVAINPHAKRCRNGIGRILTSQAVLWVEYQAPQDWLNFAGFNPVRDLGLEIAERECANPVIRSARVRDLTTETTYRAILYRPFRMHFQFLMANERPGEYDYFMIVAGPLSLAARISRPETLVTASDPEIEPSLEVGESSGDPLSRDLGRRPSASTLRT